MKAHFEHDPRKSGLNEARHGVTLHEARNLWRAAHVIIPARNVTGESRFAILGKLRGRVYVAIFAVRRGATRVISCHKADKKWVGIYEKYLG
ncbi:MAG: BrnT family toxin [Elusimicrobia bacterium]|nr:BrnT family toxin [Elusimicrobiota bacterium]